MIIFHGKFPIKPEIRDEALEMMRCMAVASRAEYGCVSYEFYVGLSDPNTLLLFQEWESVDALQGHFDTSHMAEFLEKLPDILNGEVSTRRYEVKASDEPYEGQQDIEPELTTRFEYRDKIVH